MDVEVRSGALEGDFAAGVFACRDFQQDEIVIAVPESDVKYSARTYQTIQVGENRHALIPKPTVCLNHSCDPNIYISSVEPITFRAIREIPRGEQIFFNYATTEWEMDQPFDCQCKASKCLGRVAGAKHLAPEAQAALKPFVSSFIRSKFAEAECFRANPGVEVRKDALEGEFAAGVFALQPFQTGETVISCTADVLQYVKIRTYLTIQVNEEDHVLVPPPAVCVNHSCDPNLALDPTTVPVRFRALKDIAPGDQLFFNYTSTEWEMQQPFTCQCKASICVGDVRGAKHLNLEQQKRVSQYASPFIKAKLGALDIHSGAVVATRDFEAGDVIVEVHGPILKKSTYHTIQISDTEHLLIPKEIANANHSCKPTARYSFGEKTRVIANQCLKKGTELTLNYLTTEWALSQAFECQCKNEECLGSVRGFKFLSSRKQEELLPFVSPFIAEQYQKVNDTRKRKKRENDAPESELKVE